MMNFGEIYYFNNYYNGNLANRLIIAEVGSKCCPIVNINPAKYKDFFKIAEIEKLRLIWSHCHPFNLGKNNFRKIGPMRVKKRGTGPFLHKFLICLCHMERSSSQMTAHSN